MKVQETAAAATADRLLVIGGYDAAQHSTDNVYEFDGTAWSSGPALPVALNHLAAAALGSAVYVAGGFDSSGATAAAFVLTDPGGSWRAIAPLHHPRGAHVLVALAGKLYALGGRAGSVQVAVGEVYDPTTGRWSDLPAMPHPRNHLSGYVDGSRVCVTGGREPATSARTDCFDPATGRWSTAPSLPIATSGAAAAVVGPVTVVAGGEPANETALVTTVAQWNGSAWSRLPMLVARHGTAYALFRQRLWMCGGATAPGVHASAVCTSVGGGQP